MPDRPAALLLVLLSATVLLPTAAESTEPGNPVCHPDCTKRGNCGENGVCRCPFGRMGEACEVDFLAPCRPAPGVAPNCGSRLTKSCECIRRCSAFFCRQDSTNNTWCEKDDVYRYLLEDRGCYTREGVAADKQFSKIPEPDENNVKCYSSHLDTGKEVECSVALTSFGDKMNVPLSLCPKQCNNRGYCTLFKEDPKAQPTCRCARGYQGAECELVNNVCILGCSGRGECIDAYCHCKPPYFSIGCTRSLVYPSHYSVPNPTNFKVYMYELPTQLAYEQAHWFGYHGEPGIYHAYQKFMEQFLVSPVRTEDPSEASVFYIPSFLFSYSGNTGTGENHQMLVLDYIRHTFPFWNRTDGGRGGGRDHFFFVSADQGACGLAGPGRELLYNPIKLVHFGMHTTANSPTKGPFGHKGHPDWGCFHPLRDVVAPPYWPEGKLVMSHTLNMSTDELIAGKNRLFFFAGGMRSEAEYSGNTRQLLDELVKKWKDPEFDWVMGGVGQEYEERLRKAKFCLAPYGYGFGMRLAQAMLAGCVPVIIQEHVFQPYERLLPYEEFSLRLTNADLPALREILRGISDDQFRRLQQGVLTYLRAFGWHASAGGRAFDYTIAELRRSYMNSKSLLY